MFRRLLSFQSLPRSCPRPQWSRRAHFVGRPRWRSDGATGTTASLPTGEVLDRTFSTRLDRVTLKQALQVISGRDGDPLCLQRRARVRRPTDQPHGDEHVGARGARSAVRGYEGRGRRVGI